MSQDIVQEITFFLHSIVMGLVITFAYDWLLILRRLIKHKSFWVSVEDFFFWFACGIGVFYMLYKENNGILRWFAVVGALLGMLLYKGIIGKRFIHVMSTCIYKMMWLLIKVIQVMLKPAKWLFYGIRRCVRFLEKRLKKCNIFIKKKLTGTIKMLRIVLCKH